MSNSCYNNSTLQYPPFCCARHGGESQPLLGHQNPHENTEFHVDMTNEKGAPVHPTACPSDCKKSHRRRKFIGRFFGFLFLVYLYHTFVHESHHHIVVGDGRTDSNQGNSGSGSGGAIYDLCRKYAIDWDGPSTFVTDAQNFQLRFGRGQHYENVQVLTGNVDQPTLHISGKISPDNHLDNGKKNYGDLIVSHKDTDIEIERLGLHIKIKETNDLFDAYIWFEDHTVSEGNYEYRACADLRITVTLPKSYKNYNSIVINGAVTSVDVVDLDTIAFNKLDLSTSVGHISTMGELFVDEFKAHTNTGKTEVESIQVTEGSNKALDVKVSSNTGRASVGVKTTRVCNDEPHKIDVTTGTGSVKVDATPSSSSSNTGNVGHLNINAQSRTGGVDASIKLAGAEQKLSLNVNTNTGSVRAAVSDEFLGHFKVETNTGSTTVKEASGSKSHINYQKLTSKYKSGVKTLGNEEHQSQINLQTRTGSAFLQFN
ncbi:hypothetical protein BGZ76_002646 [Entomortierella beljakovae]|nr:hypothetical protein BGZ76_002646 [Entomortierella beljakovae]